MAILNKLGSIARNVSGRTGNMLEVSKLNALIRSSEDDIEELKQQLGEYFYGKYAAGVILDGDATEICKKIRTCNSGGGFCRRTSGTASSYKNCWGSINCC